MFGNWNEISKKIEEEDKKIFENIDKEELSNYEKRKIIFDYLCNNIDYDYGKLIDIYLMNLHVKDDDYIKKIDFIEQYLEDNNLKNLGLNKALNEKRKEKSPTIGRDLAQELIDTIYNKKGICNSISQYYKLLLEHNNIYSACVICDNLNLRNHQINLVYDDDTDTYSFDDITSAIINITDKDKCFDYDYDTANELKQGLRPVGFILNMKSEDKELDQIFDSFGVILNTSVINNYVGKENDYSYLRYNLEEGNNIRLPDNLRSVKRVLQKEM